MVKLPLPVQPEVRPVSVHVPMMVELVSVPLSVNVLPGGTDCTVI